MLFLLGCLSEEKHQSNLNGCDDINYVIIFLNGKNGLLKIYIAKYCSDNLY